MKLKVVISSLLLAVYSLVFVHTIIPHDHHLHNYFAEYQQDDSCDNDHEDHHHFPHHDQSQHIDDYIFTTKNPVSQLVFQHIICRQVQIFDLSLIVCDIQKQDFYFVPPKIPNQFAEAVPLRAPPVC